MIEREHPEKPLCIDLFCGLGKSKFGLRAYSAVQEFVACRAKNPDHMAFQIGRYSPCSVSLVLRPVSDLKDSVFSARFTCCGNVGITSTQSSKYRVFERPPFIVSFSALRVSSPPFTPKFSCRLATAIYSAITLVRRWRRYRKMLATPLAASAMIAKIPLPLASWIAKAYKP